MGIESSSRGVWECGENKYTLILVEYKLFKKHKYVFSKKTKMLLNEKITSGFYPIKGLTGGQLF
jgi:hypothetical protein